MLAPRASPQQPFDLLIRGGTIVDGTGNPWFLGDVAIRGDRIIAVGPPGAGATARRVIDARGLVVAPGFIDMHSHSDMTLFEDGSAPSKIRQGVTTEILGEDTSAGPSKGKRSARTVTHGGKTHTWSTLGGYFEALERQGIAPNVASYVGLGTLLECVQGDSLARPGAREIAAMQELLDEAMREGALGLSTMLASPRELAVTTDDLVELCRVVKRHGGIYSSHIRNEGTEVFDGRERGDQHRPPRRGSRSTSFISRSPSSRSGGGCPKSIALIDAGPPSGRQRAGQCLSLHSRQQRPGQHHSALGPRGRRRPLGRATERPFPPRPVETRHPERIAGVVQPLHGRGRRLVAHAGERPAQPGQPGASRARRWTGSSRRNQKGAIPHPTRSTCCSNS